MHRALTEILRYRSFFSSFWERHPALFLGFSSLLGTAIAIRSLHLSYPLSSIFLFLLLSIEKKKLFILAALFFLLALVTTPLRHPVISLPPSKIEGTGHFHIETIKPMASAFHRSLLYKGRLLSFHTKEGLLLQNLPTHIYLPLNAPLPKNPCDYAIEGTLQQKGDHFFVLKPLKNTAWKEIENTHTLSLWRYQLKQKLKNLIKKEIKDKSAQTLLSALATGDVDERLISLEFGKIGLQHILAISGFHFALVALFLRGIFRSLFPFSWGYSLLLLSLTAYYLFLGNAPSIQRAYLAIAFLILGKFFSLRLSALNALGAALLVEIALNPLCVTELSFQLTFLSTLGILLFYAPLNALCKKGWIEHSPSQIAQFSLFEKQGYLLSCFLRQSLAINLAVSLVSLPVLLHLFHRFPLLSIAYNLFFPLCISLSFLLLCLALSLMPFFPPLSHWIHALNDTWTTHLLHITSNPPAALDFILRTDQISFSSAVVILTLMLLLAILFHARTQASKNLS